MYRQLLHWREDGQAIVYVGCYGLHCKCGPACTNNVVPVAGLFEESELTDTSSPDRRCSPTNDFLLRSPGPGSTLRNRHRYWN